MTELLQKALAKVSKLSDEDQDAIAAMLLDILEDERRWELAFAASQDKLAELAEKVRRDTYFPPMVNLPAKLSERVVCFHIKRE